MHRFYLGSIYLFMSSSFFLHKLWLSGYYNLFIIINQMLMHLATNETTVSVKKKTGYLYCVKFSTKWFVNLTLKKLFKFRILLNKIQTM